MALFILSNQCGSQQLALSNSHDLLEVEVLKNHGYNF